MNATAAEGEKSQVQAKPVWRRVEQTRPGTVIWGESLWRFLERGWVGLQSSVRPWLSDTFHPLSQLGAIANITFIIAVITGILLLFWYVPSVHDAYASLERMKQSPYVAQLMRSLHRYSSDACMLFVMLHAVQIVLARKVAGPRWLAWITGILGMATLWFLGWTGYWLVWDDRAVQVALGTSRWLDVLPIFADPLERSFLFDGSVNSLLFFIVFFFHMLVPLIFVIFIWLHITRLKRPHFLTPSKMTVAVVISLIALSLVFPAYSSKPANIQTIPASFGLDWFYMLPLYFTERLRGGTLWALSLGITLFTLSLPWLVVRRKALAAKIEESRCNACQKCFEDCPFNAISMLPREGKYELVAHVSPEQCVGCGVCVGSCDSYGVTFPALEPLDVRKQLDHWLKQADAAQQQHKKTPKLVKPVPSATETTPSPTDSTTEMVAFVCAESAAAVLSVDEKTGHCPELPGYRVVSTPCAGWVHMLTVERVIRHGASGVLIAGCGSDAACRWGDTWTHQRLEGQREPALRREKVEGKPVLHVSLSRAQSGAFVEIARNFRDTAKLPTVSQPYRLHTLVFSGLLVMGLLALTWFFSDIPYRSVRDVRPMLVVSFKHPGQLAPTSRLQTKPSEKLLPHMRGVQHLQRKRVSVRLRVWIDGNIVYHRSFRPKGVFEDGNSIAIAKIPVSRGNHQVRVEIGDSPNPQKWDHQSTKNIAFQPSYRRVVLFDKVEGFQWH